MFKRRFHVFTILTLFCLTLLSGCYPTGERRVESTAPLTSDGEPIEIDTTKIELEAGDMCANIYNLSPDYPAEAPVITLTLREWDIDELMQTFIGDNTIKEDWSTFDEDESRYLYIVDDSDGEEYWFLSEQGRFELIYQNNYGSARFLESMSSYMCFDKMFGSNDLAGFTKSDAMARVDKIFKGLGMTNISEPEIWAITADKANVIFEKEKSGDHWTMDDEVYIMKYSQNYNDIPIITKDKAIPTIQNGFFGGTNITAIVSNDKVVSFECNTVFSDESTTGSTAAIKYSPVEAFDTLVPIYENIKLGYTLNYYDCKLVYRAVDRTDDFLTYSFAPAWQFDYSYEDWAGIHQGFELVSADNGIRIVDVEA